MGKHINIDNHVVSSKDVLKKPNFVRISPKVLSQKKITSYSLLIK